LKRGKMSPLHPLRPFGVIWMWGSFGPTPEAGKLPDRANTGR
jgi:hypothetical protein